MVVGAIVVAVCILLGILAFLAPRLSRQPQRGVNRAFSGGQREASRLPGGLGRWLQRPFSFSRRAANRSASAGRRGRAKLEP